MVVASSIKDSKKIVVKGPKVCKGTMVKVQATLLLKDSSRTKDQNLRFKAIRVFKLLLVRSMASPTKRNVCPIPLHALDVANPIIILRIVGVVVVVVPKLKAI